MSAAGLAVENLSLRLGSFALKNLALELEAGEIFVILGPNGAGKSVSLEAIAGFHPLSSGRVLIRGRDVTRLPPERRNLSLLFQDFGLFPHLTVEENVALGLRARRGMRDGHEPREKPRDLAGLLADFGVAALARRRPEALSPGEKQRVALARALASHPDLFLFDEPFSALDTRTREELRGELDRFLRGLGIPAVFVTHDYTDALILADKIAVMRGGELVQSGTAADVFRRPANRFVAEFVGIENLLAGRLSGPLGELAEVEIEGQILRASVNGLAGRAGEVWLCIRAEDVGLSLPGEGAASPSGKLNRLAARVVATSNLGVLSMVTLDCGFRLNAYVMTRQVGAMNLVPGQTIEAGIAAEAIHLLPRPPAPPK